MAFWNKDIPVWPISKGDTNYHVVLQERGFLGLGKPVFIGENQAFLTEPGTNYRYLYKIPRFLGRVVYVRAKDESVADKIVTVPRVNAAGLETAQQLPVRKIRLIRER